MDIVTKIAPLALAIIMLGLGLGLTINDFKKIYSLDHFRRTWNYWGIRKLNN